MVCLTAGVGFVVCPLMIRAAANHRETDTLNLLNLTMLLTSSIEFVVSWSVLWVFAIEVSRFPSTFLYSKLAHYIYYHYFLD